MFEAVQTISVSAHEPESGTGISFIESESNLASILLFGHDPKLLQTRAWIFQQNGCAVQTVSSEHDFRTELLHHRPDVILLCQTLSADECESAAFFAEEHAPRSRCILLYTREPGWSLERDHVLLNSNDGPRTLVDTLRRVLESRNYPVAG